MLDAHTAPQLGLDAIVSLALAETSLKIPFQQVSRWQFHLVGRIDAPPATLQHAIGDVGGVDLPGTGGPQPGELREHDGQRVRLLARRGRSGPDAQRPHADPRPAHECRQHVPLQDVEVCRFAEEMRVVRGDQVDQFADLVLAADRLQQFTILPVVAQAQRAQPLSKPSRHQ